MIPFLLDAMTPWVIHYLLYYLFYHSPSSARLFMGHTIQCLGRCWPYQTASPFGLTYAYKRLPLSVQPLSLLHNIPSRLTFPSPPFCCTRLPPVPHLVTGVTKLQLPSVHLFFLFVTREPLQSRVSIVSRQASVVDMDRGGHLVFKTDHNPLHLSVLHILKDLLNHSHIHSYHPQVVFSL
jgi:hypothetical protein